MALRGRDSHMNKKRMQMPSKESALSLSFFPLINQDKCGKTPRRPEAGQEPTSWTASPRGEATPNTNNFLCA